MKQQVTDNSKKRQLLARLLVERGLMAEKESVLSRYGVDRIRDLSTAQLDELIDAVKAMPVPSRTARPDVPPEIRKARSTVLALLDDLGVKAKPNNWQPVNDYLMQPRIAGKRLDKMTEQELKDCAKKLRAIIKKEQPKKEERKRLERYN